MNEFKIISDYPNYMVNDKGDIYSCVTNKILKQQFDSYGYKIVHFHSNGIDKTLSVHRLVALTFIPNPKNCPCVNHKDENKTNNCVENLEWVSWAENNNYGTRLQRAVKSRRKRILEKDKNGNILKKWDSVKDVALFYNCSTSKVYKTLKGVKYCRLNESSIWEVE